MAATSRKLCWRCDDVTDKRCPGDNVDDPTKCLKRKWGIREDAERYATVLALRQPGDKFHAYRCTTCDEINGHRPWHVGHPKKRSGRRTIWLDPDGVLHLPEA
jgi:hypothetical protein